MCTSGFRLRSSRGARRARGAPGFDYSAGRAHSMILPVNGKDFDWRLCGGALLAGGAIVAAAFAMPVRLPEGGAGADPADRLPDAVTAPAPENLVAFLEIRRWGVPAEEPGEAEPVEEAVPALNPVLAEMGFVGLIAAGDERAVLLALPEGDIVRMLPGDTLPDGRILVSVADNRLTLEAEGGTAEVLTLFPPLPAEEAPAPAPGGLGGEEEGGGAATVLPGATGAVASQ